MRISSVTVFGVIERVSQRISLSKESILGDCVAETVELSELSFPKEGVGELGERHSAH